MYAKPGDHELQSHHCTFTFTCFLQNNFDSRFNPCLVAGWRYSGITSLSPGGDWVKTEVLTIKRKVKEHDPRLLQCSRWVCWLGWNNRIENWKVSYNEIWRSLLTQELPSLWKKIIQNWFWKYLSIIRIGWRRKIKCRLKEGSVCSLLEQLRWVQARPLVDVCYCDWRTYWWSNWKNGERVRQGKQWLCRPYF